jgi:branched-chain amino acid transport system substrate-binding protein
LEAVKATDYNSVVGPLKCTGEPVKNVTKTPLVACQWRKMDKNFNLVVCENKTAFEIPVQAKLNLLS